MDENKLFKIQSEQLARKIANIETIAKHKDALIDQLRLTIGSANMRYLENKKEDRRPEGGILRGQYIDEEFEKIIHSQEREDNER